MPYATSVIVYRRRNHTIRIVVDLTTITSLENALLTMTIRKGTAAAMGAIILTKTNTSGDASQAAVVSDDTIEFYLTPGNTASFPPGTYVVDAIIQTSQGLFQLLAPTPMTLVEPVTP
jgi:hypothetical protein